MSFISESQLANYRSRTRIFLKSDIVFLNESSTRIKTKPMVFLSHKHEELVILQDTIAFLNTEGVDIYVDWMDEEMPAYTNANTALRLKEKIKIANKFVLVATPNAIRSKWCNWELGLGDAAKYIENIALFPINRTHLSFSNAEYLKIYPYIEYENGNGKYLNGASISKGYYVKAPLVNGNKRLTPLKTWLTS
ncbi:toll/interleukin-1 receptor domain-containing protein [Spirosoma sp.]|uniref:toll/interleukin-1 receptor domain-containing protein n=1 Tax=Spirosoma sp. TaxID=1899569 RepID=UPI0026377F44|nr:toll/interleukin-1 receptor domain-containing protein [Spirosoma sp.]MCX6216627.1 toll/interleukin-1 receptor domain-containing protein [Spirosoma sp.]